MSTIAEQAQIASPAPDARAARRARARLWDRIMTGVLWGLAIAAVTLLAAIIIYLLARGLSALSWQFITSADVQGDYVGPEVFNTFYIIILALIICIPIALGAAIYLVEYAKQGPFVTIVRFATETLAGIPSLLLGLFGFLIFVTSFGTDKPICVGHLCYSGFGFSRLAGALTLVILNLPLLLRVSEDALRSVPDELREASAALGAKRFQTVARVLVPTGLPALTTGVILTVGKMIGETAALIYTAGGSSSINGWLSLNPFVSGATLTTNLYNIQAEGTAHNAVLVQSGSATLLIILLLVFNLGIRWLAGVLVRRVSGSR